MRRSPNRRRWQSCGRRARRRRAHPGRLLGLKEPETAPVVSVDVAPVLNSTIQKKITADALLFPVQQSAIIPKVTAPVKKFYVNMATMCVAGQLLAEKLENRDLAGAATESQAAYAPERSRRSRPPARATVPRGNAEKAELDVKGGEETPWTRSRRSTTAGRASTRKAQRSPRRK